MDIHDKYRRVDDAVTSLIHCTPCDMQAFNGGFAPFHIPRPRSKSTEDGFGWVATAVCRDMKKQHYNIFRHIVVRDGRGVATNGAVIRCARVAQLDGEYTSNGVWRMGYDGRPDNLMGLNIMDGYINMRARLDPPSMPLDMADLTARVWGDALGHPLVTLTLRPGVAIQASFLFGAEGAFGHKDDLVWRAVYPRTGGKDKNKAYMVHIHRSKGGRHLFAATFDEEHAKRPIPCSVGITALPERNK